MCDLLMAETIPPYHVYFNTGPDVKRTCGSLVYHALDKHGLRVFHDKQESPVEESLTPEIESDIRRAIVRLAIFSKTFADSPRRLNELLCMLDSVIPVFYDIQPRHLRDVSRGPYAEAFQRHRENNSYTDNIVDEWKAALNEVSDISGVVFDPMQDDHGVRVEEIVQTVLNKVRRERRLYVCEHPVGLRQAAEHFENEVLNPRESRGTIVVGIVGLAGSGKSTLVTHLYNKYSQFKRFCFLHEMSRRDVSSLQETLLRDLLCDQHINIQNKRRGKAMLQDRLPVLPPVLIVFDDIAKDQIEYLLFVKDVVAEGSLIFLTTRDQTLLVNSKVIIYNIKLLEENHAQELFRWYTFGSDGPPQDLQDMVGEMVRMCDGFPGALRDLAEELRSELDPRMWNQRLEILRKRRQNNVAEQRHILSRGFWMDRLRVWS